jgi:hypothetical protein
LERLRAGREGLALEYVFPITPAAYKHTAYVIDEL